MMRKNDKKDQLESIKDKSTLVKLLAEEDVTVTYQKANTASFNPITRQVILPIWKDKSESVMDMMSLHEVGHALYTEPTLIDKGIEKKVKHSFLNVLEDVRIEKMIQDKYLGSRKIFTTAYKELLSKDFFGISGKDLSKLNLIDRINMHYKHVPNIPFDNDELEWVEKANQTKTCDDVLNLAIELQEWMKQNEKDKTDEMFNLDINMPSQNEESEDEQDSNGEQDSTDDKSEDESQNDSSGDNDIESNGDTEDNSDEETSSKSSDDEESDDKENVNIASYGKGTGHDDSDFDGIEAVTDTNYQKRQYQSVDHDVSEIEYLNIPKVNLKELIVDYKQVNKDLTEHYNAKVEGRGHNQRYMDWIRKDIVRFKNEQKQTISYMVKEFEMKKAADLYKRSTVAKTGQLNMNTLHSYSYNEDIFLKMNVEPGATNHGLVMFVDWSGSMYDNFYNTIKQTLNLVWFCERVNIPFEVYAFTDGYGRTREDTNKNIFSQKRKQDDLVINELTLLNILSSRSNKNEMHEGLINLWATATYYGHNQQQVKIESEDDYSIYPIYPATDYQLHSTPLNHAIIAAMDLVPQFKKDTGVQKVHTVFLTDGYSNTISNKYSFTDEVHPLETKPDDWKGEIVNTRFNMSEKTVIVTDPVTKKKWIQKLDKDRWNRGFEYQNQTLVLLKFLKARLPGMSITNFFIAGKNRKGTIDKHTISSIFDLSSWEDADTIKSIQKEILKNNVAVCKTAGWDEMYVLPGGQKLDVSSDDMSEITPGTAKTGELKRAFSKMSSGRKNSRPLLNKFIGMIA